MSLTLSAVNGPHVLGDMRVAIYDLTFDSSYATGGKSLTPADLGLNVIDFLIAKPSSGYSFEYDSTNKKLIVRQGDNTNAAAAPAIEVPNTTDLHTLVVRVIAFGR